MIPLDSSGFASETALPGGEELGILAVLGFWGGLESRALRLLGEEDWGFFLEAAARALDMSASKAEGGFDIVRLGFLEEKGFVETRKKESVLRAERERESESETVRVRVKGGGSSSMNVVRLRA